LIKESIQQEMMDRMTEVYESARATMRNDSQIDERMSTVNEHARLYFRYTIPIWPLKHLVNKIIRRLLFPMMMPQVVFNEAVRDVLYEMRQSQERQTAVYGETLALIEDLEQQVEFLSGQLSSVQHKLVTVTVANRAPAPLTHSANGAATVSFTETAP
jgi:hypothetical protein